MSVTKYKKYLELKLELTMLCSFWGPSNAQNSQRYAHTNIVIVNPSSFIQCGQMEMTLTEESKVAP